MRKINITDEPPENWVNKAQELTEKIKKLNTIEERKDLIDENDGLWKKAEIKKWLKDQFNNKCWYSEARCDVDYFHVDHYRPKNKVKSKRNNKENGYTWLAFDWKNYVWSGPYINLKKSSHFPLGSDVRCEDDCCEKGLQLEVPLIIHPTSNQTRLISFDISDNGICIAVEAGGITAPEEKEIVKQTVYILGLNDNDDLCSGRRSKWDKCMEYIANYDAATNLNYAIAVFEKQRCVDLLQEEIKYESEYSSVAEACIRKNAPEALVAAVFS